MCKCTLGMHSFDKGRTKKLNESPTLSVGCPKKPMEVSRTLVYKTLGKSLCTVLPCLVSYYNLLQVLFHIVLSYYKYHVFYCSFAIQINSLAGAKCNVFVEFNRVITFSPNGSSKNLHFKNQNAVNT